MKRVSGILFITVLLLGCFIWHNSYANNYSILSDTITPGNEYTNLLNKYNAGNRDTSVLHGIILKAEQNKDTAKLNLVVNDYIQKLSLPLTEEENRILRMYTKKSSDPGFKLLLDDSKKSDYNLPPSSSYTQLMYIIYKEDVQRQTKEIKNSVEWENFGRALINKYGKIGDEIYWKVRAYHYNNTKSWVDFVNTFDVFMKKYAKRLSSREVNDFAYDVFENVDDKALLKKALVWSKTTISENIPNYLDTYAVLLYTLNQKENALVYEEKAVNLATEDTKDEFNITLNKMKNGELIKTKKK